MDSFSDWGLFVAFAAIASVSCTVVIYGFIFILDLMIKKTKLKLDYTRTKKKSTAQKRKDDKIFETVQEARNDFEGPSS